MSVKLPDELFDRTVAGITAAEVELGLKDAEIARLRDALMAVAWRCTDLRQAKNTAVAILTELGVQQKPLHSEEVK